MINSKSARAAGYPVPGCLDKSDVLAFNLDRGKRLQCKNGLLWVTIQNDHNDYLLETNKDMPIPARKKVIVEAEEPSCFQLE